MPTFFIVLLCLYLIGNIYIFRRARQALVAQSTGVKVLLGVLYWMCAVSFFSSFLFRNVDLPDLYAHTVHEIGTGWLVFTLYMVLLLGAFDLLRLIHIRSKNSFFISTGLTLCLLGVGYYVYQHPDTKVINIVINRPLVAYQPVLKVIAVSDLHLGYGTDKARLQHYVRMINEQNPDLILIGGDLIDNSLVPLRSERMDEELSKLKAPMGVYMVPGNHEYISGMDDCANFLATTPIRLLRDSVVTLPGGLQLIGRDDRHNAHRLPLAALVAQTDGTKPILLMDHQPYDLAETEAMGIDLQFSGHTHHGQVWPVSLVTDYLFEQSYGYRQWGKSHIYVSSGLSLWGPPFRIGTNSELVVFNLSFK